MKRLGAHDLRRTCAKLGRKSGGDLEQIKFLLGHSSIQMTERYLGSEQEMRPRSTTSSAYSSSRADNKALTCQQDGFGRGGIEIIGIQNTFDLSEKSSEEAQVAIGHSDDRS